MANHKAAYLLMASLLVAAIAITDGRHLEGVDMANELKAVSLLTCNKVHGVQHGETCFSVARGFGLSDEQFLTFNPNINCATVFVGQWVCIDAATA